jgi:hypothetical protein
MKLNSSMPAMRRLTLVKIWNLHKVCSFYHDKFTTLDVAGGQILHGE